MAKVTKAKALAGAGISISAAQRSVSLAGLSSPRDNARFSAPSTSGNLLMFTGLPDKHTV
jgi:hypothetical protein